MVEHSIRITIPADFPAEQVEKARKHWDRLSDLHRGHDIAGFVLPWSIPGAIVLTAIGATGVYDRLVKK